MGTAEPALVGPGAANGLVQRAGSGLLVPQDVAGMPDQTTGTVPTAYDPDGRRRVVLTKDDQKRIDRVVRLLGERGLGMVAACRVDRPRADGKAPCGQPLQPEGEGESDRGYGCRCTRVHFR